MRYEKDKVLSEFAQAFDKLRRFHWAGDLEDAVRASSLWPEIREILIKRYRRSISRISLDPLLFPLGSEARAADWAAINPERYPFPPQGKGWNSPRLTVVETLIEAFSDVEED